SQRRERPLGEDRSRGQVTTGIAELDTSGDLRCPFCRLRQAGAARSRFWWQPWLESKRNPAGVARPTGPLEVANRWLGSTHAARLSTVPASVAAVATRPDCARLWIARFNLFLSAPSLVAGLRVLEAPAAAWDRTLARRVGQPYADSY